MNEIRCQYCGAILPEGSQYCNVCGKSQATGGAYKIAEAVTAVKHGLERAGVGFILGIAVAVSFWFTVFAYIGFSNTRWDYNVSKEKIVFWVGEYYFVGLNGDPTIIIILILASITALTVFAGISPRFLCLVMALTPGSIMGAIVCWAVGLYFSCMIIGQILYFVILSLITFPVFIYLLVKNQLIVQKPARGSKYASVIKTELIDTAREITSFRRR